MKKALKITAIIVAAIVALLLLVSLIAPPIAKNYVNKHGEELIGRKVNIEKVGLNLFSGHVALHHLKIYEEDGSTHFAGFDTLDIKLKLLRLIGSDLYFKHITLSGLNVNILQQDTIFNFTSIIDHFASDTPQDTTESESNWKLYFYNVSLQHAQLSYSDLNREKDWKVKDLNIKVPGFSIGGEESADAGINLALADGGLLNIDAQYDASSNNFGATVQLDNFALANIKEYLTDVVDIEEIEGDLGATITAQGNVSEIMNTQISGKLKLNGLSVTASQRNELASMQTMSININKIDLGSNIFDIESVTLEGLRGQFEMYKDSTTNFSRIMVASDNSTTETTPQDTQESTESTTPAKPMDIKVGVVEIKSCHFTYTDHCLHEKFSFPVSNINLSANNINTTGMNQARITAQLPGGGALKIEWKGNIANWKTSQDLTLNVNGLDLKQLNPYMVTFLGQPFSDGTFSFTSHNTITNSMLDGSNNLDIYNVTVGKRVKGVKPAVHLPLKAALYVLKDKNEKILLDVPIKGNIESPEFNYMKLVWKTLGNLLVKVATSPVRALGDMLGISEEELKYMEILPGQTDFTSEQYNLLNRFAKATEYSKDIRITFDHQVPPITDDIERQRIETLNNIMSRYMHEQLKVSKDQFIVKTTEVENLKHAGYHIESELMEGKQTFNYEIIGDEGLDDSEMFASDTIVGDMGLDDSHATDTTVGDAGLDDSLSNDTVIGDKGLDDSNAF